MLAACWLQEEACWHERRVKQTLGPKPFIVHSIPAFTPPMSAPRDPLPPSTQPLSPVAFLCHHLILLPLFSFSELVRELKQQF